MDKTVSENDFAGASYAQVADYIALLKPRVMSLVVFSGLVGLLVAPGSIHPLLGFTVILCIAMSAGGSAAINMWFDRDIDAVMTRTRSRPIPDGRMVPQSALEFGTVMIALAVFLMGFAINMVAAALLAGAAAFYIFIYTIWLKRRTPWNIVIGGAAGAFPPMIGWAAVTGHVGWPAIILFAIIFFWTPPHFWALALYRNEDYRRAGVPMLPVMKGARRTKIEMLIYTLLLLPLSLAPVFMNDASYLYGVGAAALGLGFIVCALRVMKDKGFTAARQMFGYSIVYLFALFLFLLADHYLLGTV